MCRRVVWLPEGSTTEAKGFSLFYPAIVMHAVSRDVSDFHSPCLYMQLDAEQSFGELASSDERSAGGVEVRGDAANRTMSGARASSDQA